MFPLGSVLLPGVVLPLHVFEPRYRALVRDCLAGDRSFGVVLIERGSEVGGGDVRTDVGTLAQIAEVRELADGRFLLAAVGTARVRVVRWLDDDPYPRAQLDEWPDDDLDRATSASSELFAGFDDTVARFRRVLGLRAELNEPAPPATTQVADDPVLGSYQISALAPFGPADQQRLLAVPGAAERLALLDTLLDDEATFLEQRLAAG